MGLNDNLDRTAVAARSETVDLDELRRLAGEYDLDGFRDARRVMLLAGDEVARLRAERDVLRTPVADVTRALGCETPPDDADLVAHAAWCRAEVARQGAEIALLRAACAATQAEARAPWGDRSAWAVKLAAITAAGYAP